MGDPGKTESPGKTGSDFVFCILRPPYDTADLSVVQSKVVADCLVAVGVYPGVVGQRLGQRSPLGAGDFREIPIPRQLASEMLDEGLRAEEDLMPEVLPGAGLSDALCDEPAIGSDRRLLGAAECREQPIPAQPIRAGCVARGGAIAAPRPIVGCCDHPCADRVQHQLAREFLQVGILLMIPL